MPVSTMRGRWPGSLPPQGDRESDCQQDAMHSRTDPLSGIDADWCRGFCPGQCSILLAGVDVRMRHRASFRSFRNSWPESYPTMFPTSFEAFQSFPMCLICCKGQSAGLLAAPCGALRGSAVARLSYLSSPLFEVAG